MPRATKDRKFRVRARHVDLHHAHLVSEYSFEAAVVAYMEDFPQEIGEAEQISVIVEDLATGHAQCFKVDIDTGETEPCV